MIEWWTRAWVWWARGWFRDPPPPPEPIDDGWDPFREIEGTPKVKRLKSRPRLVAKDGRRV